MIKMTGWIYVEKALLNKLSAVPIAERAAEWDRQTNNVKAFKKAVREGGMLLQQDRCAWCTLLLGARGRRTAHRDHIAPKKIYPDWTFSPTNIVISCEFCNGFSVKCDLDTIRKAALQYDKCEFWVVHPYFDEVTEHIGFSFDTAASGVVIKGLSDKGVWTVTNLKLDDPYLTILRAHEYAYHKMLDSLPPHYAKLLAAAVSGV